MKKKWIKQKRVHGRNDCFNCCIGFSLNLHPLKIPYFMEKKSWWRDYQNWFKRRKLKIEALHFKSSMLKPKKFHIVQGISPRGNSHVVIYKGKKPFYDPNIKGGFLKGKPYYYWKISKILLSKGGEKR